MLRLLSLARCANGALGPAPQQSLQHLACVPAAAVLRTFSSGPDEEALRNAEKLIDLMANSPSMQQMMMASLPSGARNPEVIRQMLSEPAYKRKMAEMIAKQGFKIPTHVLDRMTPQHMEETVSKANRMGLKPNELFQKLMSHPEILKELQKPQVLQAFMEISQNPAATAKYASSPEILEVVRKVQGILAASQAGTSPQAAPSPAASNVQDATIVGETTTSQPVAQAPGAGSSGAAGPAEAQAGSSSSGPEAAGPAASQPPPPGTPAADASSSGSPFAAPGGAPAGAAGGLNMNTLMEALMKDPSLAPKLANPRVQAALAEISKSPWKTVKYVFDREVMDVFQALNKLLKQSAK